MLNMFRALFTSRKVAKPPGMSLAVVMLVGSFPMANSLAGPPLSSEQRQLLELYVRPDNFPTKTRWTTLPASVSPMPLNREDLAAVKYRFRGQEFTLDDYFARQPVTALLIAKDGKVVFEKYQYTGSDSTLFYSASMAKSFVGISVAILEESGLIGSQDLAVGQIVRELSGTPLGNATVRNHMRMGSGIRYREAYPREKSDDHSRFTQTVESSNLLRAFEDINQQEAPQGARFQYAGVSTAVLSRVIRAASGRNTAEFFGEKVWSRLGTEAKAYWAEDQNRDTWGYCCFLGRARDYLRLGIVLANGGKRLDSGEQLIPVSLMNRLSDVNALDVPFKPPGIKGIMGYDSQIWLSSRVAGAFALLGLYGQSISVFPKSALVVVHFGMSGNSTSDAPLQNERDAMVAGVYAALR